jgi:predicted Fe-Mo cluster-binding NifX family protein
MKITIPTLDNGGLDAFVSDHFGRSPFFTVVDTVTEEVHSITNQGQHFGGPQHPAAVAADAATDVILCTNLGRKALRYFQEQEIAVYTGASGKVRDILQAYHEGTLKPGTEDSSCLGKHD